MKNTILLIALVICKLNLYSQKVDFEKLFNQLPELELPFHLDSFSSFDDKAVNQFSLYNSIVIEGRGYLKENGRLRKSTSKYSLETVTRNHEVNINGIIKYRTVKDSVVVQFIRKVTDISGFNYLLVKVSEPIKYQDLYSKLYQYYLLVFDNCNLHLSTIKIFELFDDQIIFENREVMPNPQITSEIKQDGSIVIKWDGGYNSIEIKTIRLNDNGIFYVEKSESIKVRN